MKIYRNKVLCYIERNPTLTIMVVHDDKKYQSIQIESYAVKMVEYSRYKVEEMTMEFYCKDSIITNYEYVPIK